MECILILNVCKWQKRTIVFGKLSWSVCLHSVPWNFFFFLKSNHSLHSPKHLIMMKQLKLVWSKLLRPQRGGVCRPWGRPFHATTSTGPRGISKASSALSPWTSGRLLVQSGFSAWLPLLETRGHCNAGRPDYDGPLGPHTPALGLVVYINVYFKSICLKLKWY